MDYDRTKKAAPKPIVISGPGIGTTFFPEDYYSSILGASLATGINRHTLTQAAATGEPIKKGNGKGWTVRYRNPDDQKHRQKQYQSFQANKELATMGLATTADALSELKRLRHHETLLEQALEKIRELQKGVTIMCDANEDLNRQLRGCKCEVTKNAV